MFSIRTHGTNGLMTGSEVSVCAAMAFLTARTGDPAYWSFLAFYVVCAVVTFAYYLRPAPADAPRLAYAGV